MTNLQTPDLCSRLDSMRKLCDQLEHAQEDQEQYRALVEKILVEADALRQMAAEVPLKPPRA